MILNLILIVVAYLLGSIPSAVWIGRKYYGIDIREHGSKNAGATNTLRILGKRAAFAVFAIDFCKGLIAVLLAHFAPYFSGSDYHFNLKIALLAAAVLGHIFPIFAHFKGGKGVATMAGAAMGVYPPAVLLCMVVFFLVLYRTNYVSLSSMIAGCCFPIFIVFVFGETSATLIVFSIVVALLLLFTHRKNIKRLREHTESKTYIFKK